MARCMLLEARLAKELWADAVMASAYIRNRCYNPRTGKTPYEAMTGRKPDLSKMHIFGTTCYAYVQNTKKLDARSERGVFLGYDKGSPAYIVYIVESRAVKRVRCVKFTNDFEGVIEMSDYTDPLLQRQSQLPDAVADDEIVDEDEARRYPQGKRTMPKHLEDYVAEADINLAASAIDSVDYCYRVANIPNSYAQANCSFEADKWHCAMNEEITALHDNNTFEITPLPEGRTVVGGDGCMRSNLAQMVKRNTKPDL